VFGREIKSPMSERQLPQLTNVPPKSFSVAARMPKFRARTRKQAEYYERALNEKPRSRTRLFQPGGAVRPSRRRRQGRSSFTSA